MTLLISTEMLLIHWEAIVWLGTKDASSAKMAVTCDWQYVFIDEIIDVPLTFCIDLCCVYSLWM